MDNEIRQGALSYAVTSILLLMMIGITEWSSLESSKSSPIETDADRIRRENTPAPGETEVESVIRNLENEIALANAKLVELHNNAESIPSIDQFKKDYYSLVSGIPKNSGHEVPEARRLPASASANEVYHAGDPVRNAAKLPDKPKPDKISFNRPGNIAAASADTCSSQDSEARASIKVKDLYSANPFKNPTGGAWTQGFDINKDLDRYSNEPLKIWVVPHSHNDPGWIKTVDQYFNKATKKILSNMMTALAADPTRTFIWAEISYFSMWWDSIDEATKEVARRLIENRQFEIVSGGWVMPDEANTHYFAIVDQLIEGHQWLEEHLGVKPEFGWAIDPFGHSPTMAYIHKRSGFKGMLIQRTHYEVKRLLAQKQNLEFGWRQDWDTGNSTDIFTHMMPFYSYDVPHTCGPDPSVCCQFDFARMRGVAKYRCPWKKSPQAITSDNVAVRAGLIVDQYHKKSQLYRSNNLLIPLGDDFRWDTSKESDAQFNNYMTLFNYINSKPEWKTQIRFGTLSDYFHSVWNETTTASASSSSRSYAPGSVPPGFPTLSGDFFTYADRTDNYWSGYFTTRPFYKHFDRELESAIRSSEILFSFAPRDADWRQATYNSLRQNSRQLGVFQHHDGITGTAKDEVVKDYGNRMLKAFRGAREASIRSIKSILPTASDLVPEIQRVEFNQLAERQTLTVSSSKSGVSVVFHNSMAEERNQYISVICDTDDVTVMDANGGTIEAQAIPVWGSTEHVEVWFEASLPALGLVTYKFIKSGKGIGLASATNVLKKNTDTAIMEGFAKLDTHDFCVKSANQRVCFDQTTGLLDSISDVSSGATTKVSLSFETYGTASGKKDDKSGAYLFLPDGPAKPFHFPGVPFIHVADGSLLTEFRVDMDHIVHVARVFKDKQTSITKSTQSVNSMVWLNNLVDIRSENVNYEVVMRLKTEIMHGKVFHTDLNGFQMMKRETLDKLPMGGNFFPLPSMGILEDENARLTVNTRSSHGCSALEDGWFEVVLDRRLMQDDKRGLFQKITDNVKTESNFALLLQQKLKKESSRSGVPTPLDTVVNDYLNYPIEGYVFRDSHSATDVKTFKPISHLPCDVHLVSLRSLEPTSKTVGLILHKRATECSAWKSSFERTCKESKTVNLPDTFSQSLRVKSVQGYSLSFMHPDTSKVGNSSTVHLAPRELYSWKLYSK